MSVWSDFLWTPQFITGSFVSGLLAIPATFFTTRASQRRQFKHEIEVLNREHEREDKLREEQKKREDELREEQKKREDKLREEQNIYDVAQDYIQVCTEILVESIDTKGIFNALRDHVYTQMGMSDPNVQKKMEFSEKVVEAQTRIAVPHNKLKLIASDKILDAATRVSAAILTAAKQTTEPFAQPLAQKAASDEMDVFVNVFREEVGRKAYTQNDAQKAVLTFMDNLKRQRDAYLEEAKEDLRKAGFKTTPWDNFGKQP